MGNQEKPESLLEASADSFNEGFEAFKKGDYEAAKLHMENALQSNQYDIGAMVVLALMDPDFQPEKELFKSEAHASAFGEITKTPIVKNMYRVGNNVMAQLVIDGNKKEIKLVDIGIGGGSQEVKLAHQLKQLGLEGVTLDVTGIEPMDTMIRKAKKNLGQELTDETDVNVELEIEQAIAQNLPEQIIQEIRQKAIDVVVATISIHHGDIDDKRKMLKAIKEMGPKYFVLSDVNSDHESDLTANSDELAKNIRRFYSLAYQSLCEWADQNCPGREDVKAAFLKFNFDEARNILSRDPNIEVKDYHTTAARWLKLLKEEGFDVVNPKNMPNVLSGIEGEVHVTDEAVYLNIKDFRKLFFSIIATPRD